MTPHSKCPRCRGQGFYLKHEGRGYYPDGSFGHNQWEDCSCDSEDSEDNLPSPLTPKQDW